jgi:hypothetical protein
VWAFVVKIAMKKLLASCLAGLISVSAMSQTKHLVSINTSYVISNTRSAAYQPSITDNTGANTYKFDRQSYDGYSFGATYRFYMNRLYLQGSPQVEQVGFGYSSPQNQQVKQRVKTSYSFTYVSVPVKIGYMVVDKGIKLGFDAGIAYSTPISAKMRYEYSYLNDNSDTKIDIKSPSQTFSALLGCNIGFDISGSFKVEINAQYSFGLSDAIKGASINSLSIGASFGYYLSR